MPLTYHISSGFINLDTTSLSTLTTQQGGSLSVDRSLVSLLKFADKHTIQEICSTWSDSVGDLSSNQDSGVFRLRIRAALACLSEAGLLSRSYTIPQKESSPQSSNQLVSVVIVSYNSQSWLEKCLPSLHHQSHPAVEIIIVDNASHDNTVDWLAINYPFIRTIRLSNNRTLAYAINRGVEAGNGTYYLILNPDTILQPDAIAQMIEKATQYPACAAVAPKLRFTWAPAFLNGLGNSISAFFWGADNAIGHLDLGQFDTWEQVPSACFAAALIPAQAWQMIGMLDEAFPLYYEDSEWCYRARLMGYQVITAPQAVIYHAFGSPTSDRNPAPIQGDKLRYVTYGRLRLITRLCAAPTWIRFMVSYILDDLVRLIISILTGRLSHLRAILKAWWCYLTSLSSLRSERRDIQDKRQIPDNMLFTLPHDLPMPLIQRGVPRLTWDIIQEIYLPKILTHQTHPLPEFEAMDTFCPKDIHDPLESFPARGVWQRARQIQRNEGAAAFFFHLAKAIQWRFALAWQPHRFGE